MIFIKTEAGKQVLKERHGVLSPRQRSAFILFDGKRPLAQILETTTAMGITADDVQFMIDAGLLTPAGPALQARSLRAPEAQPGDAAGEGAKCDDRLPGERYQAAYLIANELTSSLGLRGLRLNLAVEAATDCESLAALAPRIREAVGEAKYRPLAQALFA
ncbi:MAG: hypothetical protein KGN80_12435 [Acidobacteriota bacterium]|nr:hypothetical protein [Acidobacteriota bacterium]